MESRLEPRSNIKAYVLSIISGQTFFLLLENNFEGGYYVSLALGKDFCLTSCVLSEGRNDVYFILCLGLAQYLALFMKKLFLFVLFEWFGKGRWSQSLSLPGFSLCLSPTYGSSHQECSACLSESSRVCLKPSLPQEPCTDWARLGLASFPFLSIYNSWCPSHLCFSAFACSLSWIFLLFQILNLFHLLVEHVLESFLI